MTNLVELDLSSNEFKQIEHVGVWRQCRLRRLSASNNYFDKEIIDSPKNVSECSQYALESLDLSWSLNGTIPEALGRLANLRGLHLSGSQLTGPIPKSLRRLRFLEILDLSHNQLTGSIPTFLGKLSKLDLSFNQLNGSIPQSFGKLADLTMVGFQLEIPCSLALDHVVALAPDLLLPSDLPAVASITLYLHCFKNQGFHKESDQATAISFQRILDLVSTGIYDTTMKQLDIQRLGFKTNATLVNLKSNC
ncbi:hypothetical protein L1887_14494 [Cichorium endivia]|nr:hypothetical protein L1887_14494 [Cichorium endivia]